MRQGFESADKGKNGFVYGGTILDRGNRRSRFLESQAALCDLLLRAGRANLLPITIKKTELVLAGQLKALLFEGIKIAFYKKELPPLESGAMCYMMSKQSYLGDHDGHWHPHLMSFVPLTDSAA